MTNSEVKHLFGIRIEWLTLTAAVISSLAMIAWVLWKSHFGFDLTDEGYYLVWISNPWIYKASVTQFGYIYHPLYLLVGGDIALLRQANILITLVLAWGLSLILLRNVLGRNESSNLFRGFPLFAISLVLSTTSLALLSNWLPTPNYNSLALQALLIAGIGILIVESGSSRSSLAGWVIIGIGGWMAFMAKPTTAGALGLVAGLCLLFSGKLKIRMCAIALATAVALWILSAYLIDGSIAGFVARLIDGAEDAKQLGGGHTLSGVLRLDSINLGSKDKLILMATTLFVLVATNLSLSADKKKQIVSDLIVLMSVLGSLATMAGLGEQDLVTSAGLSLLIAAPLGIVLAGLRAWQKLHYRKLFGHEIAVMGFFALLPHIYVFGSASNYWAGSSRVALFWLLSGVTLLTSVIPPANNWRSILPAAVVAQAIAVMLIHTSMEHPYRQTLPLRQNQDIVRIASTGSEVLVSPILADYIRNLDRLAKSHGFNFGDAMIDLTGENPGALYAIGAKSIGAPWMIGGYKGSEVFASAALNRVSCIDLGSAWILTEPSGRRPLSPALLKRYGIDLAKDYAQVGRISSPAGLHSDNFEQHLLKPNRTFNEARDACVRRRGNER